MAGVLQGLANSIFGVDPIADSAAQMRQQYYDSQAKNYSAREASDYAAQQRYAAMLRDIIKGTGMPSLAQRQMVAGQDATNRGIQSGIQGASGSNAGLARYGAVLQQGSQDAALAQRMGQQQSLESLQAQQLLGGQLNAMGGRSAALMGQNGQLGLGYSNLQQQAQIANQAANQRSMGQFLGLVGSGIAAGATLGAAGISAPAAQAAAPSAGALYAAAAPGLAASQGATYSNPGIPEPSGSYGVGLSQAQPSQVPAPSQETQGDSPSGPYGYRYGY